MKIISLINKAAGSSTDKGKAYKAYESRMEQLIPGIHVNSDIEHDSHDESVEVFYYCG